jgi:hypothetical protein
MPPRSGKIKVIGNPVVGSEREMQHPTAISPFLAVLEIILTTQQDELKLPIESKKKKHLDPSTIRTLRLTSKAVRAAIDSNMKTLLFPDDLKVSAGNGMNYRNPCFLRDVSTWRWTNLAKVELGIRPMSNYQFVQRDLEDLVALPLPKLASLSMHCCSALPLIQSNWPELNCLKLAVVHYQGNPKFSYPRGGVKFPNWPLKEFYFRVEKSAKTSFLGALLKSVSGTVNHVEIQDADSTLSMQVATAIASAPLPNLTSLNISSNTHPGFWPKMFSRDWPALENLTIHQWKMALVPLLLAQNWLPTLEGLELMHCHNLTATELRTFLQTLEKGAKVEKLTLGNLKSSIIPEAFRGIKLEELKLLSLERVDDGKEALFEGSDDISTCINIFFDGCSLPKLEKFAISSNRHIMLRCYPRWSIPPTINGEQFKAAFPLLKEISLCLLEISTRAVADYLGLRRQEGCRVELLAGSCKVVKKELAPSQWQNLELILANGLVFLRNVLIKNYTNLACFGVRKSCLTINLCALRMQLQ